MKLLQVGSHCMFLVVGDRCWGKALTDRQAWRNACHAAGREIKNFNIFLVPSSACVDERGQIVWERPKEGLRTVILLRRVADGRAVWPEEGEVCRNGTG